jgi:hypothetical protein
MPTERHVFLSLRAVSRPHLFAAARSMIGDDEPRGPDVEEPVLTRYDRAF